MKIDVKKLEILQARECINNKDLRDRAQLGYVTLTEIKQGKRNLLPITVGKIARALNCDVTELLED